MALRNMTKLILFGIIALQCVYTQAASPTLMPSLSSVPLIAPNSSFTCPFYSAVNTNSANQKYSICSFRACGESSFTVSGCDCSGDQFLRLYSGSSEVEFNDDNTVCNNECSFMTYTVPGNNSTCSNFSIKEGCYGKDSCSGFVTVGSCSAGWGVTDSGCQVCKAGTYSYNSSCESCPEGTYSLPGSISSSNCSACPAGTYSLYGNPSCISCPAGQYNSESGSSTCYDCPAGTYLGFSVQSSISCTNCPGGMTSKVGSTNEGDCVAPLMNTILAFILLFLSAIGLALYIVGGRLERMAFVRKERLVSKSKIMFYMTFDQLLNAGALCSAITLLKLQEKRASLKVGTYWKKVAKWVVLYGFFFLIFVVFILSSVLRLFFTSLILWRGYDHLFNVSYLNRITDFTNNLLSSIHLEALSVVVYPFIYALNAIGSLQLNFNAVQVHCYGSQTAIQLFLDCVIVGVAVIIIQSEMEVFWGTVFENVHNKFRSLLFQRRFWSSINSNVYFLLWSTLLELVPRPSKILQYCLGLVRVMVFFEHNGHAKSSVNCDKVLPLGNRGADTVLAAFSTAFAYAAIFPVIYLFSQVLVPQFKLQPGTVKAEGVIHHQASRHADKLFRCEKCNLGLHRHYTSHFGKFHCDCVDHQTVTNSPMHNVLTKHFVVYGCPSLTACNWAVCDVCYESSQAVRHHSCVRSSGSSIHSSIVDDDISKSVVEEEIRRSSVVEKQPRKWSRVVPYLKIGVMLISLDWFYIKLTFEFAKAMFKRMVTANESLILDLNSLNGSRDGLCKGVQLKTDLQYVPVLPWFYALRHWYKKTPDEQIQEESDELNLQYKWNRLIAEFPTYYRMVLTVQDDLMPKYVHKDVKCSRCNVCPIVGKRFILNNDNDASLCQMCDFSSDKDMDGSMSREVPVFAVGSIYYYLNILRCGIIVFASWTFPGQLCSERGRRIWVRVGRNYLVFVRIVLGYWSDKAARDFNLFARFDELTDESALSTAAHKKLLASVNSKVNVESAADDKAERMDLVSALVSSRVVLIQLIPYLTFLSTLAVDISASPILVYNKALVDLLPPFFMLDSMEQAKESLLQMGNDTVLWKVRCMAVYLCFQRSRSIQFFLSLSFNLISLGLIFGKDKLVQFIVPISLLLILVTSTVKAIYAFILLHKLLYPPNTGEDGEISERESAAEGVEMHARS